MKVIYTIILLVISNVFMTFAWYGHLKNFKSGPLIIAILASWGIAFFEYSIQVPANRMGHSVLKVEQLKIIQELVALSVFVPFSILFLKEKISTNYIIAGCFMLGAAYFIFKK